MQLNEAGPRVDVVVAALTAFFVSAGMLVAYGCLPACYIHTY